MPYSIEPLTDDCYPGTTVLINKLDIRDSEALDEIETELVTVRIAQCELSPIATSFDFNHYKA